MKKVDRELLAFLGQAVGAVVALVVILFAAQYCAGCAPHQMQPVREAIQDVQTAAEAAQLCAAAVDAATQAELTVSECMQKVNLEPMPEVGSVHPCIFDALALVEQALQATERCEEALR